MKRIPRFVLMSSLVTVGACEHATGSQPRVRPHPEFAQAQAMFRISDGEMALLLETADRVEQKYLSGELRFPQTGHPLDGLAPEQIQALFAAARLPAEPYLPAASRAAVPR